MFLYSVHIKINERINIAADKDSGLQNMEVLGVMNVKINDGEFTKITLHFENNEDRNIQFQVKDKIIINH